MKGAGDRLGGLFRLVDFDDQLVRSDNKRE